MCGKECGTVYGKTGGVMAEGLFVRYRAKNTDPGFNGSPRAKSDRWQLIIERDVPNPEYVPKADALDEDGNDARAYRQKRRTRTEQKTRMLECGPIVESKARAAAQAWMEQENARIERESGEGVTVPDYVDAFLDRWERSGEKSTMWDYRKQAKRIRKGFDGVLLHDLTGKMVTAWIDGMHRDGLSQATQVKAYRLLNLACRHAVKDDDLDANPCDKADAPKAPKPDPNPLTEKSRATLVRLLADMEPTPLAVAAYIGIYMGLRESEICALRWRDVDMGRKVATVHAAIGRADGKTYLKRTKTDGSMRSLPIPEPLVGVLEARAERMRGELAKAGMELDADQFGELHVIGYVDGRYKNPETLGKEWRGFAEAFDLVGTKGRLGTFHDTRHTFATVAVAEGIDIKSIASYMGHSNANMTLNIYADDDENAKRAAADTMGTAY